MGFVEFFRYIKYGIVAILVFSGGWIVLNWGYNITVLDNPPTLMETAQNYMDYWSKSFSKINIF